MPDSIAIDLAPGAVVNNRYIVLERIGIGRVAMVYKCRDCDLGARVVAMKVLFPYVCTDKAIRERFRQEISCTYAIHHPNVVRTFEYISSNSVVALVMEYVDGGDLSSLISTEDPLDIDQVMEKAQQMCAGLNAIHEVGIVHRDLKPENILLTEDGQIKIADFGIAWTKTDSSRTKSATAHGTIGYVSPEYLEFGHLDKRGDIYALGILFYEMITGRSPFAGNSPLENLTGRLRSSASAPHLLRDECPGDLSRIVMKAMARDPRERYQHVDDITQDLDNLSRSRKRRFLGCRAFSPFSKGLSKNVFFDSPDKRFNRRVKATAVIQQPANDDLKPAAQATNLLPAWCSDDQKLDNSSFSEEFLTRDTVVIPAEMRQRLVSSAAKEPARPHRPLSQLALGFSVFLMSALVFCALTVGKTGLASLSAPLRKLSLAVASNGLDKIDGEMPYLSANTAETVAALPQDEEIFPLPEFSVPPLCPREQRDVTSLPVVLALRSASLPPVTEETQKPINTGELLNHRPAEQLALKEESFDHEIARRKASLSPDSYSKPEPAQSTSKRSPASEARFPSTADKKRQIQPAAPSARARLTGTKGVQSITPRPVATPALTKPSLEYRVKGTLLYKLASFIDWPAKRSPSSRFPFQICLIGGDPFGDFLDRESSNKKSAERRKVRITRLGVAASDASLCACHVAFFSPAAEPLLAKKQSLFTNNAILTVSETRHLGIVGFYLRNGLVRFTLDEKSAAKSGLVLHPYLRSLAGMKYP